MTDVRLLLESERGNINLNALLDEGEGAQALAGLSGLGLPPTDVQWVVAGGEGARYLGRRDKQRDIDLPLYLYSHTRSGLKEQLRTLGDVLSGPCVLRLIDSDGIDYEMVVHHVGGGDYIYGRDTRGNHDVSLTITLRSESPYWLRSQTIQAERNNSESGTITLRNPGSIDAYPIWELRGPGMNFLVTMPDGETVLNFSDYIAPGVVVTINTETGEVVDSRGDNRYSGLGSAPQLFKIPTGTTDLTYSYDLSSVDFLAVHQGARYNYLLNPTLQSDGRDWTMAKHAGVSEWSGGRIYFRSTRDVLLSDSWVSVSASVPEGESLYARIRCSSNDTSTSGTSQRMKVQLRTGGKVVWEKSIKASNDNQWYSKEFTTLGPNATLRIYPRMTDMNSTKRKGRVRGGFISAAFIGQGENFHGDSTSTDDVFYEWTGEARYSISRATPLNTADTSQAQVKVSFQPRERLVI